MKLNFRRDSKDRTNKTFLAKLQEGEFDFQKWRENLARYLENLQGNSEPELKEKSLNEPSDRAWQVPAGYGRFIVDIDKMPDGDWKKRIQKSLDDGTYEIITKEKSNGTPFRTVGRTGEIHQRAIGPKPI